MITNVREITGPWDIGYSLDKHTLRSTYVGDNEFGHPQFDTIRSEVGEALFQLKFRSDASQAAVLATQLAHALGQHFASASFILPMPPSKQRKVQPVIQIALHLANIMGIPCREDVLVKLTQTAQMKDIPARDDRVAALRAAFTVNDVLPGGNHDVLVVDDLFDTGTSLEAATDGLRGYAKIRKIFVTTVTRRR